MSDAGLSVGVHGAACGLFLLLASILWRDGRASDIGRLSAALAAGGAAGAVTSTPGFLNGGATWQLPILVAASGTPVVFWLWARAGFGEDFRLRRWHSALWAAMAAGGLTAVYGGGLSRRIVPILSLGFAVLATIPLLATWHADLVAERRRLRAVVLAGTVAAIAADSLPGLTTSHGRHTSGLLQGLGLLALAALASWSLLRIKRPTSPTAMVPPPQPGPVPDAPPVDPVLLQRLEHLMATERAYRQEGLTIGALAARLTVPEHRLRQVINQGLGQRNFNTYVNRYRVEDAKAALADPSQQDVPILTIAMDAGFQSLGPFNRAFKSETGLTPTEYRRDAMEKLPETSRRATGKR